MGVCFSCYVLKRGRIFISIYSVEQQRPCSITIIITTTTTTFIAITIITTTLIAITIITTTTTTTKLYLLIY